MKTTVTALVATIAALVAACGPASTPEASVEQSSTSNTYCGSPPYYTCQPGSVDNCVQECQYTDQGTGFCPEYTSGEWFHCGAVGWEVWTSGPWNGMWRCYAGQPATPMRCISGFPL